MGDKDLPYDSKGKIPLYEAENAAARRLHKFETDDLKRRIAEEYSRDKSTFDGETARLISEQNLSSAGRPKKREVDSQLLDLIIRDPLARPLKPSFALVLLGFLSLLAIIVFSFGTNLTGDVISKGGIFFSSFAGIFLVIFALCLIFIFYSRRACSNL
ncbi:Uncharacterised protein [uncultured archaeon]|nr:Uncharacterised protein [uncultured archaeon]